MKTNANPTPEILLVPERRASSVERLHAQASRSWVHTPTLHAPRSAHLRHAFWFAVLLALLLAPALVPAQNDTIPAAFNYQGKLTDNLGVPLASGTYTVQFRIWNHATKSEEGDYIWGGSFPVHVVSNGLFNVLLTDDGGLVTTPYPPKTTNILSAFAGKDRYLGLTIAPATIEISPRQRVASAPFAIRAWSAALAENLANSSNMTVVSILSTNVGINKIAPTSALDVNGTVTATTFSGSGSSLTSLNANNLSSGTVADARLSANVALLNGATNRFTGVLQATNVNNQLTGVFTGNGGGLTNLSGASLTGTVADARLSSNVALLNGTNVFSGPLYGSAPYLKFAEVTNATPGSAVAGTNNWRKFNAKLADTHLLGSTNGAGDILLPTGTYQCRISAPAFRVQTHQIRLRTSSGVNLLYGTMGYSDESLGGSADRSQIDGQFNLVASTTLRVQHWCTAPYDTGLGALVSVNWGDTNQTIFAVAEFWKIK